MSFYMFWQDKPKTTWKVALADHREMIIKNKNPCYISVLDADNDFTEELTAEEVRAIKYTGPMFIDLDSDDATEVTEQFKKLLLNLQSKGVNLHAIKLFATGGRGYHLEMPMQMLMPKVPSTGIAMLPQMYKEVAHKLFVDTMDMRIYSSKRGRMWRCTNVQRPDNGLFKVQITVEEALNMTPELYKQVCTSPRNSLPIEPATLDPELGLLFAQARDKIDRAVSSKTAKKAKAEEEALKKFKGEWPETLKLIMLNVGVKPDIGWNYLSLQLALSAVHLGKSVEDLIDAAQPLIQGHVSDSQRYNTPQKRTRDLQSQYSYVEENPSYSFSIGAVLNILLPELRANADIALGEYIPDTPEPTEAPKMVEVVEVVDGVEVKTQVPALPAMPEVEHIDEEEDSRMPIRISKAGIFVRTEDGWRSVSEVGFGREFMIKDQSSGDVIGYEMDIYVSSVPHGRHLIGMDRMLSKSAMQAWTMRWSVSMSATDNQTSRVADILRKRATKSGAIINLVPREGLDLIVPPNCTDASQFDLIWASMEGVKSTGGNHYRLKNRTNANGRATSDLMNAPPLTLDDGELIDNLFNMNSPATLGRMIGWFSAAHMCQIIRRFMHQFPSLQVFGQAGAGKSCTVRILSHLHYFMTEVKPVQAQAQTNYALLSAVASSASIPVVFEEVKGREMPKATRDYLLNLFRNNYDGNVIERGSLTKDGTIKEVVVNRYENSAPIVFVGEAIESQSAIMERCVVVAMSKGDRNGRTDAHGNVMHKATDLGKLGKAMAEKVLRQGDPQKIRDELRVINDDIVKRLGARADDLSRPAYNLAVAILGLRLLKSVLNDTFGTRFDAKIAEFEASIVDNVESSMPKNLAEASRVLDVMAQLSHNTDPTWQMVHGIDYMVSDDGKYVDLKMKSAFSKYVKYQRSLGFESLYDNDQAFIIAMNSYSGCASRSVPGSVMMDSPMTMIYRFHTKYLEEEGLEQFKGR